MLKEALFLNAKEEILEATTSNFFAFKDGVLLTPPAEEILIGITREIVLKLAAPHFKIEERSLTYSEIASFDETFITASTKEVMPVVTIDGNTIGKGVVGPQTKKIMQLFADYTQQLEWPELHITRYQSNLK